MLRYVLVWMVTWVALLPAAEGMPVVVSTSILADLVQRTGGADVRVMTLIGRGEDPHVFRPAPRQAVMLQEAMLIVDVGLGYAPGVEQMLAEHQDRVLSLAPKLLGVSHADPAEADAHGAGAHDDHGHHGHGHNNHGHDAHDVDPHFWQDPRLVRQAVDLIRAALSSANPARAAAFKARALVYDRELVELDTWIRQQIERIPGERRLLVSGHDAFGHFVETYDFDNIGSILGISTAGADPSPRRLAELSQQILARQVPVLFPECGHDRRLLQALSRETGVPLAKPLGTGSLGPMGSDDDNYVGFMRRNVKIMVENLAP